MKAMIMAGGEGARLRPLTCDCPKPIVPLNNRPVMGYALDLLKRHGISDICATIAYQHEKIIAEFGQDGGGRDVNLSYFVEDTPIGTAGSVKRAAQFIDETFVVLSGDGLTNCNLTSAIAYHKQRGALATLVLKRVEFPLEYGVIMLDANGLIRRFLEKPDWSQLFSDTVNTGIYILEPEVISLIPDGIPYDFGKQLFPAMVAKDAPVYGYVMDGYWCDIGDQRAYQRAHRDILDGIIDISAAITGADIDRTAQVHQSAVLTPPCVIGAYSRVEAGAHVGPYTVIGRRCSVQSGARVERSVLWDGCVVGKNAGVLQAVVCSDAVVGQSSCMFPDSALGEGAQTGHYSEILPGVRVWPHRRTPEGGTVSENWIWQEDFSPSCSDGCFNISSPQSAARLAQAYAIWSQKSEVLVAVHPGEVAKVIGDALSCGLRAQGVNVINAGVAFAPQVRDALKVMGASGALIAEDNRVSVLGGDGVPLSNDKLRTLESVYFRQDHAVAFSRICGREQPLQSLWTLYAHRISKCVGDLSGMKVAIYAPYEIIALTLSSVLTKAGCACRASWQEEISDFSEGEIGLFIDQTCERLRICDDGGVLTDEQQTQLSIAAALDGGVWDFVLPTNSAHICAEVIQRSGANLRTVSSDPRTWQRAISELSPAHPNQAQVQLDVFFDAIASTVHIVSHIKRAGGNLRGAIGGQSVYRRSVLLPVTWRDKGRLLRLLMNDQPRADMTDGAIFAHGDTLAQVLPSSVAQECRVIAQAHTMEAAQELCDIYADKVRAILNDQSNR